MIVSHSNKFIFFKPMKVAGTSIEAALWRSCDREFDIYTGAILKSEIESASINVSPANNWKENKVINREEAITYFLRNGQHDLLEKIRKNTNINKIRLADPIFYEHTSPKMVDKEYFDSFRNYKKISICRNPFDILVSYYWWAFNVGETSYDSFNDRYSKNRRNSSSLAPSMKDSISILKEKMKKFYYMPATFSKTYRPPNIDQSVIEWIAEWQNEFFLSDIDFWIRFENLESSYESTCESLSIDTFKIPRFKSGLRAKNYHFMDYYDKDLIDNTKNLFHKSMTKFKYG